MSLSKYNQKRNFEETKEPKGKMESSKDDLIFVVQKHAASRLHYDFRLELNGVLLSWAVPKGPSMNPEVKRLAIMVEDHPYSYKDFEGEIPRGNYGAGHVIVWDNGTYKPSESTSTPEKTLKAQLKKGRLSFILKGEKLKGEFILLKLKDKEANNWLLFKTNDKYASEDDILEKNTSVISKKTLEEIAKKSAGKKGESSTKKKRSDLPKSSLESPAFIKPMLAKSTEKPFDHSDWVFETKYDGYRAIGVINEDNVELWSRNHNAYTDKFQALTSELKKIKHTAVLDGEVVVEDKNGKAGFQLLQNYIKTGKGHLKYYVFDILHLDGNSTMPLTLLERKELLKLLLSKQKLINIFYSQHTSSKGLKAHKKMVKHQGEGIIAKRSESTYQANKRSDDWLKIKIHQQEEAIIIGITSPKNSRKYFGALLLGQYKGKQLQFIGKCGTGFKEETLKDLYQTLKPYFTNTSPLSETPALRDTIQWVKPKMVCQVKFTEWTDDWHLRHPVYLGLRTDKKAKDVIASSHIKTPPLIDKDMDATKKNKEKDYDLKIGNITLYLTNQNKWYFPKDGITKGDIVNYYNEVSDLILPYIKNRPQSMHRFPNGITASGFYQKDVDVDAIPKWLKTEKIHSESNDKDLDYLICNNKQTLLYMANLGCIDINPWNSTIKKLDNPDWMVMDIDPANKKFEDVVTTALMVKEVMEGLECDCYCKTSGASGLHVYIPLGGKYHYDQVKLLAELIAIEVQQRLPKITTIERTIKKRNQKIYVDYLQNRRGQTLASAYTVRPVLGANVSTPLEWKEVTTKLHPSQFTIKNVLKRFDKKGDLWSGVLGKGIDIKKILNLLAHHKKD